MNIFKMRDKITLVVNGIPDVCLRVIGFRHHRAGAKAHPGWTDRIQSTHWVYPGRPPKVTYMNLSEVAGHLGSLSSCTRVSSAMMRDIRSAVK